MRPRLIASQEIVVLLAALAILLGVWTFGLLAAWVTEGETQAFDEWALRLLRDSGDLGRPIGPRWLPRAAAEITALGSGAVLHLIIFGVAGYLALERRFRTLALVTISAYGGMSLVPLLKGYFGRPRPSVVPHLVEVSTPSFPSGHAISAAVVYLTLGALLAGAASRRSTRIYLLSLAILITLLVGLTRVVLGVHYPTDVLAGWSVGIVWALGCGLVARQLARRGIVRPGTPP